jgi:acyl-CoA thioesterase I
MRDRASGPSWKPPAAGERRRWLRYAGSAALCAFADRSLRAAPSPSELVLWTFGDSILDCGHYNDHGLTPGRLLIRNDDRLFPEFKGRDLRSRGPAHLEHRATDGATVDTLPRQARGVRIGRGRAIALLTIGGNDLLDRLAADKGDGMAAFRAALDRFLRALPIRPVLVGNVYDPTFGDDARNFLAVDAKIARANHARMNATLAELAARYGALIDLHAHFLRGDPTWFTHRVEPSLIGASEVRRAFLAAL